MVTQRCVCGDLLAIDPEFRAAILVDEETVTLIVVPLRDQALGAVLPIFRMRFWRRWPRPALQSKTFEMKLRLVFNNPVRAAVDNLLTAFVITIN